MKQLNDSEPYQRTIKQAPKTGKFSREQIAKAVANVKNKKGVKKMSIKLTNEENEVLHKYIVSELGWLNYCIEGDEELLVNPSSSDICKKAVQHRLTEQKKDKKILNSIKRKLENDLTEQDETPTKEKPTEKSLEDAITKLLTLHNVRKEYQANWLSSAIDDLKNYLELLKPSESCNHSWEEFNIDEKYKSNLLYNLENTNGKQIDLWGTCNLCGTYHCRKYEITNEKEE